jgi:hypothetical protein
VEPHDATIFGEHPVLHLEGLAGLERSGRLPDHFLTVVGVQGFDPQLGVRHPLIGPIAKDVFDLGADELLDDLVEASLDGPDVDDRWDLFDEGLEPRLQFRALAVRSVRCDGVRSPLRACIDATLEKLRTRCSPAQYFFLMGPEAGPIRQRPT